MAKMKIIIAITVILFNWGEVNSKPGGKELNLDVSHGIQMFSKDVLKQLVMENDDNFVMSPISLWSMMTLLSEGANGQTLTEIAQVLRHPSDRDLFKKGFLDLTSTLTINSSTTELHSTNYLFFSKNAKILPSYVHLIRDVFFTKAYGIDFMDLHAANLVNRIISDDTSGHIKKLISKGTTKMHDLRNAKMILTNAVYFKGQWKFSFDPDETIEKEFYDDKGVAIGQANYMVKKALFPIAFTKTATVVELPYDEERNLSMIAILPDQQVSLKMLAEDFVKTDMETILEELRVGHEFRDPLMIVFPRFKTSSNLRFKNILKNMGIRDVFDQNRADLQYISKSNDVFLSAVIHKATVEVNEEGTSASAASGGIIVNRLELLPIEFNRPFLYFILEKNTKIILFQGAYFKPELH